MEIRILCFKKFIISRIAFSVTQFAEQLSGVSIRRRHSTKVIINLQAWNYLTSEWNGRNTSHWPAILVLDHVFLIYKSRIGVFLHQLSDAIGKWLQISTVNWREFRLDRWYLAGDNWRSIVDHVVKSNMWRRQCFWLDDSSVDRDPEFATVLDSMC